MTPATTSDARDTRPLQSKLQFPEAYLEGTLALASQKHLMMEDPER